jgi:TPR repeat protein
MTMICIARVALLASLIPLAIAQGPGKENSPNFQLLDRSVVDVEVTCPFRGDTIGLDECSGRATGIVLSERDGIVRVLTARHEVHGVNADPNAKIRLVFAFDQLKSVPAKLLSISNEQLDLAVLEAELPKGAVGFGSLPLAWSPQIRVKQGMELWAVDGTWKPRQGNVVGVVQDQDGPRIRYTCEAANGYSGGPVFDANGDLIAVHLRSRPELAANLRDGVTMEAVVNWLKSIGYSADSINRLIASNLVSSGNYLKANDSPDLRPLSSGDRGTLLFRAGRYNEAKPLLTEAANAGDAHAAMILSGMYLEGQGVPRDYAEGNRLARIGAVAGNDISMNTLGASYTSGTGLPQNYVLGAYWYRKSAELGSPAGMFGLALLYANGQINADATAARIPKHEASDTDAQAVYWYKRASQAGDLRARAFLGIMYGNGRGGLAKNDRTAAQLFRSAADQGEPIGMVLLGDWYLAGRVDGRQNFDQAVYWYKRGAALGDEISRKRLRSIPTANPGLRF